MNELYIHKTPEDMRRRGDLMLQVQGLILGETGGRTQ